MRLLFTIILFCFIGSINAQYTRDSILVPYTSGASPTWKCLVYKRSNYPAAGYKYPLLVFLHGAGESGSNLSKIYNSSQSGGAPYFIQQGTFPNSFTVNGQTHEFIIVAPQGSSWGPNGTQTDFVLRHVVPLYNIDTSRIYVYGLSAGGAGTVEYVAGLNSAQSDTSLVVRWKAAAAVAHAPATNTPQPRWGQKTVNDSVRVWTFGDPMDIHGLRGQQFANSINAAKANYARYTQTSAGHSQFNTQFNPSYTENIGGVNMNIYQWMLQFQRGVSAGGSDEGMHTSPLVDAGANQTITLPTSNVSVTATPTLYNGATANYRWTKLKAPGTGKFKVTVAGSSTSAGYGLSAGESYVDRMRSYYIAMGLVDSVRNIAVGGTSPWDLNFTSLFVGNPNIVLINYPTNAYDAGGNTPAVIAAKYQQIKDSCDARGVQFFCTGTQPRNYSEAVRLKLKVVNDTLRNRFGERFIDFFTYAADTSTNFLLFPDLDQGDGIHVNAVGHSVFFNNVKAANIFKYNISSGTAFSAGSSLTTNITGLTQGVHLFQASVFDSYGAAASDTMRVTVNPAVSACSGVRYLVPDIGYYYNSINLLPGDTLDLGTRELDYMYLNDKHGLPGCPIVVMNSGGVANIKAPGINPENTAQYWGDMSQIRIENCTYIKVTGSGSGDSLGIRIQSYGDDTLRNGARAVEIFGLSKNIEVERLDIRNVGIGMSIKEDENCDPAYQYPNFVMDSIFIHHCRIRQTWNQGLYIGNTAPDNAAGAISPRPIDCGSGIVYPRPIRLGNIRVWNMDIDSTGRAGIQVSAASTGTTLVHDNVVKHSGMQGDPGQGFGIVFGTYTRGKIYNNTVVNTYMFGVGSQGVNGPNNIEIYNNTIDSVGYLNHFNTEGFVGAQIIISARSITTWNGSAEYAGYEGYNVFLTTLANMDGETSGFTITNNIFGRKKSSFNIGFNGLQFRTTGNVICGNVNSLGGAVTAQYEGPEVLWDVCAPINYLMRIGKGSRVISN